MAASQAMRRRVKFGFRVHKGARPNDRAALAELLTRHPAATVAVEAGTPSPWISRYLTGLGAGRAD